MKEKDVSYENMSIFDKKKYLEEMDEKLRTMYNKLDILSFSISGLLILSGILMMFIINVSNFPTSFLLNIVPIVGTILLMRKREQLNNIFVEIGLALAVKFQEEDKLKESEEGNENCGVVQK
jgi:uncharacterized protein YacL